MANMIFKEDEQGNPIVMMNREDYEQMQEEMERLRIVARENYLCSSFAQAKNILEGKAKGKPISELVSEVSS